MAPKEKKRGIDAVLAPKNKQRRGSATGGVRQLESSQKLKFGHGDASASAPPPPRAPSRLVELLVFEVMWGFVHATVAQRIAEAARVDGLSHPDLEKLAGIGATGMHRQNTWRDLLRMLKPFSILQALGSFRLTIRTPPWGRRKESLACLWPHKLFSVLYHKYGAAFLARLCGGSLSRISEFWDQMKDHPAYASLPALSNCTLDLRKKGIPISLHGDGVTCIGIGKKAQKHADVISWSSMLSRGTKTQGINFVILLLFTSMLFARGDVDTLSTVWSNIIWSLYWLSLGLHPDRDVNGRMYDESDGELYINRLTLLADGFFAVLWVVRADIDWLKNRLGLKGLCFLCDAGNTFDTPWTDTRLHARWISTIWNNATHAARFPNRHALFRKLKGCGICLVIPDVLHTKHLGVDAYFCGGVLNFLIWFWMPGTLQENLDELWHDIVDVYAQRKTGHRYTLLTLSMIQSQKSPLPKLSGRGAVIKDFLPVLSEVATKYLDLGKAAHRDMLSGLKNPRRLDQILDGCRGQCMLPADLRVEYRSCSFTYCQAITALIWGYHPHVPAFHFTEKAHLLLHMAVLSEYVNPDLGSCYMGEELMAVMRRIVASSGRGSKPITVCNVSMRKYVRGVGMDLELPYGIWRI